MAKNTFKSRPGKAPEPLLFSMMDEAGVEAISLQRRARSLVYGLDKKGNGYGVIDEGDDSIYDFPDKIPLRVWTSNLSRNLPFMAVDSIRPNLSYSRSARLVHYHYDLESFLWTLMWCMTHYKISGKPNPTRVKLALWTSRDMNNVSYQKRLILQNKAAAAEIFTLFDKTWKPRVNHLEQLLRLFKKINKLGGDNDNSDDEGFTIEGLKVDIGRFTYEKFIEVIKGILY